MVDADVERTVANEVEKWAGRLRRRVREGVVLNLPRLDGAPDLPDPLDDAPTCQSRPEGPVRISVMQIDFTPRPLRQGNLLLDVEEPDATGAVERVNAWPQARGYARLQRAIEEVLGTTPESGFAAIINKPHSLMVLATWPWAPAGHEQRTTHGA